MHHSSRNRSDGASLGLGLHAPLLPHRMRGLTKNVVDRWERRTPRIRMICVRSPAVGAAPRAPDSATAREVPSGRVSAGTDLA